MTWMIHRYVPSDGAKSNYPSCFSWFLRVSKAVIAMRHGSKEELAPKRPDLAVKLDDQNSARDEPTTRRMRYRRWTLSNQKVMYGGI